MFINSIFNIHPSGDENIEVEHFYKKMAPHDFSDLFEKNEMRRMSDLIKYGIGSGLRAFNSSSIDKIDAIISGTGKGSISKIEQFLNDINTYNESALNPAVFSQSTHNTVNGQIALKTQSNTYNMTHVNNGYSLHNVLVDSELFVEENQGSNVLSGVFEENTSFNVRLFDEAGLSGIKVNDHYPIIHGEGVTFFMLGDQNFGPGIEISSSVCFDNLSGEDHWAEADKYFENVAGTKDLGYLLGYNNTEEKQTYYKNSLNHITQNDQPYFDFKQESGEHETAGGYAIYLAYQILNDAQIKKEIFGERPVSKIVIFNHFKDHMCHLMTITKSIL